MDPVTIESESDDGLFGIVNRAQAAVLGEDKKQPVGVLAIDLEADELDGADVQIEAAFAHKGLRRVIQRLGVHARAPSDRVASVDLVADALSGFGGQKYTNICLAAPDAAERRSSKADVGRIAVPESGLEEALDLTVYFPSRVSFWAKNLALVGDELDQEVLSGLGAVLAALGVRSRHRGNALLVAAHQLRPLMTAEQQVAAFRAAEKHRLPVSLYAATLPTTQSMRVTVARVKLDDGTTESYVDCQLSHGLTPESTCTLSDATRMQGVLSRHFGVELGGRRWRVENVHGEPAEAQPRRPIKWSPLGRRG